VPQKAIHLFQSCRLEIPTTRSILDQAVFGPSEEIHHVFG
jgi:hypothetical protein